MSSAGSDRDDGSRGSADSGMAAGSASAGGPEAQQPRGPGPDERRRGERRRQGGGEPRFRRLFQDEDRVPQPERPYAFRDLSDRRRGRGRDADSE